MRTLITLSLTYIFFFAAPAAWAKSDQTASPLESLYACAKIKIDNNRLACYDAAAGVLKEREEKKEIVAIDANTAKTIKREAFGFSLPSLPKLGLPSLGKKGEDTDVIELAVRSVSKSRKGIIITMENGQIWRGVSGNLNYVPKGKLTARIKTASLGSYRLSLSNGKERVRGLGVRRVE